MSKATERKSLKSWHSIVYMSLTGKDTHYTLKADSKLVSEGHIHVILQNMRKPLQEEKKKKTINCHHHYHPFHHKLLKLFNF